MPTFTGLDCAIMMDVLIRVSLVLIAGLALASVARRNAALGHAVLVAGLAAAFIVPVAMLTMQILPVSRLQLGLLERIGYDVLGVVTTVGLRPPFEPHHLSAAQSHPASAIVPTQGHEARLGHAASGLTPIDGRVVASALVGTLLLGAIAKLTGLGLSLLRLRRIVARARPIASDQVMSILRMIQERTPMRWPPRLVESAEVSTPVAAGVIGAYVLLPAGWAANLCRDEMLAVLCHESAHLARRDHYIVIVQELFASVFWFHPLVHLYNRVLNRVREEVCDNHAIAIVERPTYCEALLHLAVGRPATSVRGVTSMWTRHWSLEDRIRGILDNERPTTTRISHVARSMTATISLAICGLVALPQLLASPPGGPIKMAAWPHSLPSKEAGQVANELTKTLTRSFPVRGKKQLRFENLAGRVELVPGKGTAVEVEAIVRVGDLSVEDGKRLVDDIRWIEVAAEDAETLWGLAFSDGRYKTVRYPVAGETKTDPTTVRYLDREIRLSRRRAESVPSVQFDLRISVPREANVAVRNAVGPIEGENIAAPLELTTHHGVIKFDKVRAPIIATSELGDVLVSRLNSNAVVRTGSGNIEVRQVTGGQVALSTRTGDCRILQPPDAGYHLQYTGNSPIRIEEQSVQRISTVADNRYMEFLSRGTGGPTITVTAGTGNTVIESGL